MSTAASSTSFDLYDPFCKVRQSTQTTAGQSYGFQYTYDRAGNLKTLTYPSGRVVTTSYDDAGRPVQMTGLRAGASTTYVSGAQYAAHGALMLLQLGNGVTESTGYNNRLQMQTRTAGLPGITLLGLSYGYAVGANNGNVQSQTISHSQIGVSGQADFEAALNVTQNYTYSDGANRLTGFEEAASSRTYGYDSRGNRWVAANVGLPSSNLTPTSGSWFDAATNRISGGVPDGRGNQTLVSPFTVSYDGENRVTAVTSVENGSGSYEYDGEGRRVRKLRHKLFLLPGELIRPQNRPVLRLRQSSMLQALADDILRKIATLKPLPP